MKCHIVDYKDLTEEEIVHGKLIGELLIRYELGELKYVFDKLIEVRLIEFAFSSFTFTNAEPTKFYKVLYPFVLTSKEGALLYYRADGANCIAIKYHENGIEELIQLSNN